MTFRWLEQTWWNYSSSMATKLLQPLSWLYGEVIKLRRECYQRGIFKQSHPGVPVIVIGNIVVGGAGKTPVTQAVVRCLLQAGYRPGIISRGYPISPKRPRAVTTRSLASDVGDEPILHAALGVPVVVCASRIDAAHYLLEKNPSVDVLVADDALQHYALMRDFEIEVLSAEWRYGNGLLLPAGPLREPRERARQCALRLMPSWSIPTGTYKDGNHHLVRRRLGEPYALLEPARKTLFSTFSEARPAIVAGIANPRQFFDAIRRLGIEGDYFPFPDHYAFSKSDFAKMGERPILMTEKDATKCARFADHRMWGVPLTMHFAPESKRKLLHLVRNAHAAYAEVEPHRDGHQIA